MHDNELVLSCVSPGETSGTTATFVIVDGWTVTVASVGDSRCIVDTQGGTVSTLTVDHRLEENVEECVSILKPLFIPFSLIHLVIECSMIAGGNALLQVEVKWEGLVLLVVLRCAFRFLKFFLEQLQDYFLALKFMMFLPLFILVILRCVICNF